MMIMIMIVMMMKNCLKSMKSFLIIYHLSQIIGFFFFPGGFKVFFVALVQSFSHYNNVAQKLVSIICLFVIYCHCNHTLKSTLRRPANISLGQV